MVGNCECVSLWNNDNIIIGLGFCDIKNDQGLKQPPALAEIFIFFVVAFFFFLIRDVVLIKFITDGKWYLMGG